MRTEAYLIAFLITAIPSLSMASLAMSRVSSWALVFKAGKFWPATAQLAGTAQTLLMWIFATTAWMSGKCSGSIEGMVQPGSCWFSVSLIEIQEL